MKALVKKFLKDERGLETVEYAVIAGLILIGTIATIYAVGQWVGNRFTQLQNNLANPNQ